MEKIEEDTWNYVMVLLKRHVAEKELFKVGFLAFYIKSFFNTDELDNEILIFFIINLLKFSKRDFLVSPLIPKII